MTGEASGIDAAASGGHWAGPARDGRAANAQLTLVTAARIHTMADAPPMGESRDAGVTGMVLRGNRVLAVGPARELESDLPASARRVDLGEACVTPGLIDAHAHPLLGLEWMAGADLSRCGTLEEARSRLSVERERLGPGQWLRGWGLDPSVFGGRGPGAEALGPVFDDVRGYLLMHDGHSALVSSRAMREAGITGDRAFRTSARIVTDGAGRPTGHLLEAEAMDLVAGLLPRAAVDHQAEMLRRLLGEMRNVGLTGVHALDFDPGAELIVQRAEELGPLDQRLVFSPWVTPAHADRLDDVFSRLSLGGDRWRVGGVKLFIDGTVDGGTAWLEAPDCCGHGDRTVWGDFESYRRAVEHCVRRGVPTATHAIGDRGAREVLELLQELSGSGGGPRHKVEHLEVASDEAIALLAANVAAASMQPLHATRFMRSDMSDTWSSRLGAERASRGFRCKDIRAAGGVLALGSDWPIAPYDPRMTLADAVLRRPFDDPTATPLGADQALTALEALEGYTTHAASSLGEERDRGRIAPGRLADLTVFGEDPLAIPAEALGDVAIVGTFIDGEFRETAEPSPGGS